MLVRFLGEYEEKAPALRASARALVAEHFDEAGAAELAVREYVRILGG
jgi:hypothetical protein